jgi:hypothetical protein
MVIPRAPYADSLTEMEKKNHLILSKKSSKITFWAIQTKTLLHVSEFGANIRSQTQHHHNGLLEVHVYPID